MLKLEALELKWIKGSIDDPEDQCAHGYVNFSVGDTVFVSREDGEITVSGAAFYLLRTLSSDHSPEITISESNLLFPCCAFNPWLVGENNSLLIMGCNSGVDVYIRHLPDNIVVIEKGEKSVVITEKEWLTAVLNFVGQVESFYSSSSPKAMIEDELDRYGWDAFWSEWHKTVSHFRSAA